MTNKKKTTIVIGIIVLVLLVLVARSYGVIANKGGQGGGGSTPPPPSAGPHSLDLERDSKQFLSIVDREQSGLDLSKDLTVEAWVKLESLGADNTNHTLVDKGDAKGNSVAYRFFWRTSAGHDDVNLFLSPDGSTGISPWSVPYPTRTDTWTHLAATFNSTTNKTAFYVNGQQLLDNQQHPLVQAIFMNNQPFYIGARGGAFDFLDGKIDDVRVWNVERTAQEIQDNYRRELAGNEPGLAGYWKFNAELVGGKAKDSSPNGNHLKANNGLVFSEDIPF